MSSSSAPKAISRRISLGGLSFMSLLSPVDRDSGSMGGSPDRVAQQAGSGDVEMSPASESGDGGHHKISVEIGDRKYSIDKDNIDFQEISESLSEINPFIQRKFASLLTSLFVLEIPAAGEPCYRHRQIRDMYKELVEIGASAAAAEGKSGRPRSAPGGAGSNAVMDIQPKDIRRLEFPVTTGGVDERAVVVRKHCVLFVLDPIRALVMADKLIFIVPAGGDTLMSILEKHMRDWLPDIVIDGSQVTTSFEMHAYEAMLMTIKVVHNQELERISSSVADMLRTLRMGTMLSLEVQERMREVKNQLSNMMADLHRYINALTGVLDDNDAMPFMALSQLKARPSLYLSLEADRADLLNDTEIEDLVEGYMVDASTMRITLENLKAQMTNAEELISLRLDTSRNELLMTNTFVAIYTLYISFAGYIAGIFGMNLDNATTDRVGSVQPAKNAFPLVFALSFVSIFVGFYLTWRYLQITGVLPRRVKGG